MKPPKKIKISVLKIEYSNIFDFLIVQGVKKIRKIKNETFITDFTCDTKENHIFILRYHIINPYVY